jgi:hypothetical protein
MATTAQPIKVDGVDYPSKTAAIMALSDRGAPQSEIARKIGITINSVGSVVSQQKRKRAKANPTPEATPGLWTPEKAKKVRRLFGKTMILIAEAVQVPPAELLTYVLHGVIPPSQAVSGVDDIRWTGNQAPSPGSGPGQPQLPAPGADDAQILPREVFEQPDTDPPADFVEGDDLVEPGRDDDEAELAALAAEQEEVAPAPAPRFQAPAADPRPVAQAVRGEVRLIDETGRYLHESLEGMTTNPRFAWKGDAAKLKAVQNRLPHTRHLDVVAV